MTSEMFADDMIEEDTSNHPTEYAISTMGIPNGPTLPALIDRAARALSEAISSAEVLEARDMASAAYDAAKTAGRIAKAKQAHDTVLAQVYRAQADALLIESRAKMRLAEEYDAARDAGEVAGHGGARNFKVADPDLEKATIADIGLTKQEISEARQIRDAEAADPGVIERVVEEKIAAGEEPTKSALREAVKAVVSQSSPHRVSNKNPHYTGPDPRWDAMLAVSAGCRDIMDKVGKLDPEFIISGFVDESQKARNLAVIGSCRDFLTNILEAANA